MADDDGKKRGEDAPLAKANDPEPEAGDAPKATAGDASSADAKGADAPSEPKKKKKKKKKRTAETSDEPKEEKPAGPVLNAEGWERPGFVLDFPKDPELDRLVRAFELGNYALIREQGPKLAEGAADEDVRRAAGELLRRIEPDPLVKILFAMSVGLFLFMVFYAYSHGH